jgi:hypothetical protein
MSADPIAVDTNRADTIDILWRYCPDLIFQSDMEYTQTRELVRTQSRLDMRYTYPHHIRY